MSNPLVSGFTFIKNGLTLGYPIRESILSIEPLCDEIVINVGYDDPNLLKDDGTYEYLRDFFTHPKFKFLKSFWNPELKSKGLILSDQTNIALRECRGEVCQYIQGDEVIHEDDLSTIHDAIIKMLDDKNYDALIFKYIHFYGDVDIYKYTRDIYRREIRTIRNNLGIKSWLDAQGFRHKDDTKINGCLINARILHYGWARKETVMKQKIVEMDKLYHGSDFVAAKKFEYQKIWGLKKFTTTHPKIMADWIKTHRNNLDILSMKPRYDFHTISLLVSDMIEEITDYRIGEYKNYKRVK